jgi:hypothetical protein
VCPAKKENYLSLSTNNKSRGVLLKLLLVFAKRLNTM